MKSFIANRDLQRQRTHLPGSLDLGDVVHDVQGEIVRAAAVARRAGGQADAGLSPAAEDPGRAAHGVGGDGLASVAPAEERRRHARYRDYRVPAAARLGGLRLRQRRQEGGLARRRPRALAPALAQSAHLRCRARDTV